jgi:hypothetical protein
VKWWAATVLALAACGGDRERAAPPAPTPTPTRNRYQDPDGAWIELPATFHRLSCAP